MIERFTVHREHKGTPANINDSAQIKNSVGAAHELDRMFWLVFKQCGCTEEYRRTPSIFGELEYFDAISVPMRVVAPPTQSWFGAMPSRDRETACRGIRCKNCRKEVWQSFQYFEEFVEFWCKNLVWYESFTVFSETVMAEPVFKLESVESGNAAHFQTRPLTPIETMKYLGYTDFSPNEEK